MRQDSSDEMSETEFCRRLKSAILRHVSDNLGLCYADRAKVCQLIERQLGFRWLPHGKVRSLHAQLSSDSSLADQMIQMIEEWSREIADEIISSDVVYDCEQVARYLDPNTGGGDREKIRAGYWEKYYPVADVLLRAALVRRHGNDVRLAEALDFFDAAIFARDDVFGQRIRRYDPAKGKTFDQFMKWLIIRRVQDAISRLDGRARNVPIEEDTGELESFLERLKGFASQEAEPEEAISKLREVLDGLLGKRSSTSHLISPECIAAFELWCKAYIDPQNMAEYTQEQVAKIHGQGGLARLSEEFQQARHNLQRAEDAAKAAKTECEVAEQELQELRELLGYPFWKLTQLETTALQTGLSALASEKRAVRQSGRGEHTLGELGYMEAFLRWEKALDNYAEELKLLKRYRKLKRPWVRTEIEIAAMLGVSQPTVSRCLAAVKEMLGLADCDDDDDC